MSFCNITAESMPQWTWLHRKIFTQEEQESNKTKTELSFSKSNLPHFGQLIFSWNSFRPEMGHFNFYSRVRDNATKKWSKWHKMISWGASIQKSYKSIPDQFSSYHHVRLETAKSTIFDAFGIKIEAKGGADLALVKGFNVAISDFSQFLPEDSSIFNNLSSINIKGVPCFSQFELIHPRNNGMCSPTSCAMLVSYLTKEIIDPLFFAEKSFDSGLDKYGSWPFNMAHAFEQSKGALFFAVARLKSFKYLHNHLKLKIPVVVSVRGSIQNAPKAYENGHLLVVIGYDSKTKEVICNDPALPSASLVKQRYPLKSFLLAWERSNRLAYIAQPMKGVL